MMRLLLRLLILLTLLRALSAAIEFRDLYEVALQKDDQIEIVVKYAHYTRVFRMRWTLYVNEGLVLFHSYDKQVFQKILYRNIKNQTFKVFLKAKGADFYEVPYLLVKFEKFDFEKNRAEFKIFLMDTKNQIEIQYPKKKM